MHMGGHLNPAQPSIHAQRSSLSNIILGSKKHCPRFRAKLVHPQPGMARPPYSSAPKVDRTVTPNDS